MPEDNFYCAKRKIEAAFSSRALRSSATCCGAPAWAREDVPPLQHPPASLLGAQAPARVLATLRR